ncbi:FG-GAP repeat protein [Rubripirellula lacrimiformis]|uniref:FG-GAP repeat protein n=1 Tax=Rubripirellula lacrimiformis TaxID=1930273 RepID=A0A517NJ30_9BACT|nr:VCBS repeat-containing protein [Rubripirellula lacrimiformis]QDT07140.1 FG-GAP repeat protein [Rubripirellula lacrimiformis]
MFRYRWILLSLPFVFAGSAPAIEFEKRVLDPQVGDVCYAVTAADVDGDGDLDAVAISEREAVWFENPTWKKRVMVSDACPRDLVCIAAGDIDADGQVDFALGAGWPKNGGTIHWITRGETLDDPWSVHSIGAQPWTHRMRFADVLGRGRDQLVVTPLNAVGEPGIRLMAFSIPADPVAGPWQPVVMDGSLNKAHNHWHRSGPVTDTIVASDEGLTRLVKSKDGFQSERLSEQASGEVKSGVLGDRKMLATIEPMHGSRVAVHIGDQVGPHMKRIVLDDSYAQGHAVWCADFDGDGRDEVVAAHREPKSDGTAPGIYLYRSDDESGDHWTKQAIDLPMACEDVWCADFNGDGRVDILAGGRATQDVNLYLNVTGP